MASHATNVAMSTSNQDLNSENVSGYDDYAGFPGFDDPPVYDGHLIDPDDPISTLPTV